MTVITETIRDITGQPDNSSWQFTTVLREGSDAASVVTPKVVWVQPVAGVLTVELDPGPATAVYRNESYAFTVPDADSELRPLIAAAMGIPPTTSAEAIAAAVAAYLAGHPGGGGGITDVVQDTTPHLGGNLDLNGFTVGAASASDLTKLHGAGALSGNNTGDQTNISGNAATATSATTAGSAASASTAAACTGNAATATKLATSHNINGVGFDGSAAIVINPLVNAMSFSATPTFDLGAFDVFQMAAVTAAITSATFSNGVNGKTYTFMFLANGAYALAFGSAARAIGITIPSTVNSKYLYLTGKWNTADGKMHWLGYALEA